MFQRIKELWSYRELIFTLTWKDITVRYKQAYLGIFIAILRPTLLMLIFTVVRSFVGIETKDIPYPILTFAALLPWVFFQEATGQATQSIVSNSFLIRKIYFPREILPLSGILARFFDLSINFLILGGLMAWYKMVPTQHIAWVPLIIFYTVLVSLCVSLIGSALNVYYRDIANFLPVALNLLMYASPVIYPLTLVKDKLVFDKAFGSISIVLYKIYTLNPMVGIIDSFQKTMLSGEPPDFGALWPGMVMVIPMLLIGYRVFKKAEAYFADII